MGALSIAIVQAEARKQISPHLILRRLNSKNCFEWVFSDGTTRNTQEVPVDKIRGIKLDEWLRYAQPLVGGPAIEGAPPVKLNANDTPAPSGPAGGPNPGFMLIRSKTPARPFNNHDPEAQGYQDAIHGITANPFGTEGPRKLWDRGHDRAFDAGEAELARFGRRTGKNAN